MGISPLTMLFAVIICQPAMNGGVDLFLREWVFTEKQIGCAAVIGFQEYRLAQQLRRNGRSRGPDPTDRSNIQLWHPGSDPVLTRQLIGENDKAWIVVEQFPPEKFVIDRLRTKYIREDARSTNKVQDHFGMPDPQENFQ